MVNIAPGQDQHAKGSKARNQHGQADLRQHDGQMVNIDHEAESIFGSGDKSLGMCWIGQKLRPEPPRS